MVRRRVTAHVDLAHALALRRLKSLKASSNPFLYDFRGSAKNPANTGITPETGNRIFIHKTRAAMLVQRQVAGFPLHLDVSIIRCFQLLCSQFSYHIVFNRPVEMRPANLQLHLGLSHSKTGVLKVDSSTTERLVTLGKGYSPTFRPAVIFTPCRSEPTLRAVFAMAEITWSDIILEANTRSIPCWHVEENKET